MLYLNRVVCHALDEMRKCFKTFNFAPIPGLIEEVQSMVNRMEAGLADKSDLKELDIEIRKKRRELKKLKQEIKDHQEDLKDE